MGGAKARPRLDAAKKSNTIFGGLQALLGGVLLFFQQTAQFLLDAAAQAASLAPVQSMLAAAGANLPAIGFGFVVFGVLLAISRRVIDASPGGRLPAGQSPGADNEWKR